MKAKKRNTQAEAIVKANINRRDWRTMAERIEISGRAMIERYAKPIRNGNRRDRHPLNAGATAALAELDNLRRAVDAGDADKAASSSMLAIFELWTAADTFAREGQRGQGLTLWRGLAIVATPAEAVLLQATREAEAIDLPAHQDDISAWAATTGCANRAALKVCCSTLNKRLKAMGLTDRFKLRGDRLILAE